ncbi:T9SS type A sorting domain-containing protein, partial [Aureitalea sp. L0-47]|uniref:T9SS type A sorting domain-containing protein n=1 Tax=Aureitalea sp. L0-47 TaxID=2816962 RepID=UPI002236F768
AETRNDVFSSSYNVQQHTPANFIPHPSVPAGGTNFMDDNLDDWNEYTSGTITPGEGFLVYPQSAYIDPAYNGPPPVSTIVFDLTYAQGTLNNGDISRSIEFNGLGTNPDGTPNFLANPYASAIDGSVLVSSNPLINEVYFWEHLTPPSAAIPGANIINVSMGDLSMYNGTMGMPAANDPGTSTTPNGVISTAQGFGIKAFGSGTVTFDNSMRLTTGNSTLRAPENLDKIVLKVQAETYEVRGYAGIGFRPEGTADLDENMDSNRLATLVSLYSHLEDGTEQLGIQTREPFDSSIKIPMGFATQVEADLEYTISIASLEGSNISSSQIYLIDNELGIITDLSETDYQFRSNQGEFNGRFTIQFEPDNTLGSKSDILDNISVYPNPTRDILNIQSNSISVKSVEVYDIQGRRVESLSVEDQTSLSMNISSYRSGVYFVKINT